MLLSTLKSLAERYKDDIIIYKVNTDEEKELAAAFGITSFPTLLFIPMDEMPQVAQGALAHVDHDPVIGEGGNDAHPHDTGQVLDVLGQTAEVLGAALQHGDDIVVHQRLGEGGPHHGAHGGHQDAPDDQDEQVFVVVEHIAQDPLQNRRSGLSSLCRIHKQPSLLYAGWSKSPPPLT